MLTCGQIITYCIMGYKLASTLVSHMTDRSSTDTGEAEPHFSDIISFFFGLAHDPPPDFSVAISHPW